MQLLLPDIHRRSSILTCSDDNVCEICSGTQSQGVVATIQKAPEVVHCLGICHIQLHINFILNLSLQICDKKTKIKL